MSGLYFTFCIFMLQCLKRGVALLLPYSQTIQYFVQVDVILLQIYITIWTGFGVQCTKVS